ncbi:helix-turn-helix domain-containing protein [Streptomyces sp. M19]
MRTDRQHYCGHDAALSVVDGRWKYVVVWQLASEGPRRFGQLRRLVNGVTAKVFIGALKELGADGVIARKDFREVPRTWRTLDTLRGQPRRGVAPSASGVTFTWARDHPYSQADHPSKFPQERSAASLRFNVTDRQQFPSGQVFSHRTATSYLPYPEFSNSPMPRMSGVIPRQNRRTSSFPVPLRPKRATPEPYRRRCRVPHLS